MIRTKGRAWLLVFLIIWNAGCCFLPKPQTTIARAAPAPAPIVETPAPPVQEVVVVKDGPPGPPGEPGPPGPQGPPGRDAVVQPAPAPQPAPCVVYLQRGEGPTQAMRRAGWDTNWLSQVLRDSGIDPKNVRKLPVGTKLVLTSGDCHARAPRNVADATRNILRQDYRPPVVAAAPKAPCDCEKLTAQVAELEEQVATERQAKLAAEDELKAERSRANELDKRLQAMNVQVGNLEARLKQIPAPRAWWWWPLAMLLGLVIGMILGALAARRRMLRNLRNEGAAPYLGRHGIVFTNANHEEERFYAEPQKAGEAVRYYRHGRCDKRIPENELGQHLFNCPKLKPGPGNSRETMGSPSPA